MRARAATVYDLTAPNHVRQLKKVIREHRPFHTHLSPVCRIFSQAYHPRGDEETDARYLHDLTLAENIIELAHYIHQQGLHGCIEVPKGANRFWKLERVVELKRLPGWFVIDIDGCMYGMRHPMTGLPTKKSWRFLTNAWHLTPLGICCDGSHTHTPLEGSQWTRWSQVYPRELFRKYARLIREG